MRATLADSGARVRHTITHRAIEVELWTARAHGPVRTREALRWADPASREVALTALARQAWGARAGSAGAGQSGERPLVYAAPPNRRSTRRRTSS